MSDDSQVTGKLGLSTTMRAWLAQLTRDVDELKKDQKTILDRLEVIRKLLVNNL